MPHQNLSDCATREGISHANLVEVDRNESMTVPALLNPYREALALSLVTRMAQSQS